MSKKEEKENKDKACWFCGEECNLELTFNDSDFNNLNLSEEHIYSCYADAGMITSFLFWHDNYISLCNTYLQSEEFINKLEKKKEENKDEK